MFTRASGIAMLIVVPGAGRCANFDDWQSARRAAVQIENSNCDFSPGDEFLDQHIAAKA